MHFPLLLEKSIFANLKLHKMTRATFNVLYYINRGKKLKNGTVPIYARITVNKERWEFAISRFVDAEEWNVKIGRVISTSKSAKEINSYLDLIK